MFEEKLTVLGVSMELFAAIFPDEAGKKADVAIEATMVRAGEFQAGKIRLEQGISIFFFFKRFNLFNFFLKGEGAESTKQFGIGQTTGGGIKIKLEQRKKKERFRELDSHKIKPIEFCVVQGNYNNLNIIIH